MSATGRSNCPWSPGYQVLIGGAWALRQDADRKSDYWTTTAGRRLVTSVEGKATGERVTTQLLDDVLNAADVHSEAERKKAIRWVTEILPTRLDDPENATRILIGQRLHPEDPISVAVEQGWRHLVLPAIATDEPCELRRDDGSLIWADPRPPGEPLFDLLRVPALERLKKELGSAAFCAQYQQVPHDESSAMLPRAWWRFYRPPHAPPTARRPPGCDESPAAELPTKFDKMVIACDLTFGSLKGDWAVAQVWGAKGGGRYLLEQWRKRAGFEESSLAIKALARKYPSARVIIEKAANGAAVIETLAKEMPNVIPQIPQGRKEQRASAVAPTVESGSCYLPAGWPGLDDFVDECAAFPGKHDDQVDCLAWALIALRTSSAAERFLMAYSPRTPAKVDPAPAAPLDDGPPPQTPDEWRAYAQRLVAQRGQRPA